MASPFFLQKGSLIFFPASGHGVLLQTGASSNAGGLLSGVGTLETVVDGHVAASMDFTLALNLLMGSILLLFSAVLLAFLTLGLVSG